MIQDFVVTPITPTLPAMMGWPTNPHYENWAQLGFADSPDIGTGTIQALRQHKQSLPAGCFKHSFFERVGHRDVKILETLHEIMAFKS